MNMILISYLMPIVLINSYKESWLIVIVRFLINKLMKESRESIKPLIRLASVDRLSELKRKEDRTI